MADLKSWNPWHGCKRFSEGCDHCYMYALDKARRVPEKSAIIAKTKNFYHSFHVGVYSSDGHEF